jgi:hypothetical protein
MARWTLHTPCGLMLPEKLLIDRVDDSKVIHVLHEDLYGTIIGQLSLGQDRSRPINPYRCLDDLPNLAPASLDNTLQVLKRLACLRFHTALNKGASLWIEAEASRNEHKGWAHDGLAIWPNRLRCICSMVQPPTYQLA